MSLKAAERKKALLCLATHSVRTFSPLVLLLLLLYASNGFSDDGHGRKSLRPSWDGPLWAGQHQLDRLFLPPSNHFNSQFLYLSSPLYYRPCPQTFNFIRALMSVAGYMQAYLVYASVDVVWWSLPAKKKWNFSQIILGPPYHSDSKAQTQTFTATFLACPGIFLSFFRLYPYLLPSDFWVWA